MKVINRDFRAYQFLIKDNNGTIINRVIINGKRNMRKQSIEDGTLMIINDHVITEVDDDVWAMLVTQYGKSAPFTQGLIYADKNDKNVIAFVKERVKEKVRFAPKEREEVLKTHGKDLSIQEFTE